MFSKNNKCKAALLALDEVVKMSIVIAKEKDEMPLALSNSHAGLKKIVENEFYDQYCTMSGKCYLYNEYGKLEREIKWLK